MNRVAFALLFMLLSVSSCKKYKGCAREGTYVGFTHVTGGCYTCPLYTDTMLPTTIKVVITDNEMVLTDEASNENFAFDVSNECSGDKRISDKTYYTYQFTSDTLFFRRYFGGSGGYSDYSFMGVSK